VLSGVQTVEAYLECLFAVFVAGLSAVCLAGLSAEGGTNEMAGAKDASCSGDRCGSQRMNWGHFGKKLRTPLILPFVGWRLAPPIT
jgi:hypothetical protein